MLVLQSNDCSLCTSIPVLVQTPALTIGTVGPLSRQLPDNILSQYSEYVALDKTA